MITTPRYFSPREVSEILSVSSNTARNMIKRGDLDAFKMPPGGHYKIAADEILRYVDENAIPLPKETRQFLEKEKLGEMVL